MTIFNIVRHDSQGYRVCLAYCLIESGAICNSAGNLGNLGDPAAIGFRFGFDDESQVFAPRTLWWLGFRNHIRMMLHGRTGCTVTNVTIANLGKFASANLMRC